MHILGRRRGDIFRHRRRDVRTIYEAVSSLHHPRDRGLDHAVEREKHLKPIFNLKNLIFSEPSKSIPLSIIADSREKLNIPFRPIEFIRKYPSIFQEFYPGSLNIQPHIKLTPELISLNSEEDLVYESVDYKENVALRLLKLLMIGRVRKVPIFVLERLKWELGLMKDYEKCLIPEFPDYFRVVNGDLGRGNGKMLELVCWSDEFAVSEMEKKCANDGKVEFSINYPKELQTDKKYKKWVDEWQKLPYVSPYKDSMHLAAKSDESDKWTVAVLHELLHLFVGKKVERDNLLFLGEWLGLRSRFKPALLQHPGIFYVSGKIGTHTVVLKEAYKRGTLAAREPLMDVRFKYVQLMNVAIKDDEKRKNDIKKTVMDVKKGEEGESLDDDGEDMEENDDESDDFSDNAEFEQKIRGQDGDERLDRRYSRRVNVRGSDSEVPRKFSRKGLDSGGDGEENSDLPGNKKNRDRRNTTKRGRATRNGDRFEEKAYPRRKSGRDRDEEGDVSTRHSSLDDDGEDREENDDESDDFSDNAEFEQKIRGQDGDERLDRRYSRRVNVRGSDSKVPRKFRSKSLDSGEGGAENSSLPGNNKNRDRINTTGRATRNGDRFEEKAYARRKGGRDREEEGDASKRHSRRVNVRNGDSNVPIRSRRKRDVSGNRVGLRTEKN